METTLLVLILIAVAVMIYIHKTSGKKDTSQQLLVQLNASDLFQFGFNSRN